MSSVGQAVSVNMAENVFSKFDVELASSEDVAVLASRGMIDVVVATTVAVTTSVLVNIETEVIVTGISCLAEAVG